MNAPALNIAADTTRAAPDLKLVPPVKTWSDYLAEGRAFVLRIRPNLAGQESRINELARGWAVINAPISVFAANRGAH
jgi:hypothetical protein